MQPVLWWVQEEFDALETVEEAEARLEQLRHRIDEIDSEIAELELERRQIPALIEHVKVRVEELVAEEDSHRSQWRQAMRDPNQSKFPWAS